MLAVLIGIVVLHVLNLIILIISTSVNAWRTGPKNGYDLWNDSTADWIQAVQALMILSTVFCLLSLIFFVYQLFTMAKGGRFFFTATFQILSSIFVMSGAIIYTVMNPNKDPCGYAFVLAWLAFPLTLISGLIYIILRKKE